MAKSVKAGKSGGIKTGGDMFLWTQAMPILPACEADTSKEYAPTLAKAILIHNQALAIKGYQIHAAKGFWSYLFPWAVMEAVKGVGDQPAWKFKQRFASLEGAVQFAYFEKAPQINVLAPWLKQVSDMAKPVDVWVDLDLPAPLKAEPVKKLAELEKETNKLLDAHLPANVTQLRIIPKPPKPVIEKIRPGAKPVAEPAKPEKFKLRLVK